MMIDDEKYRAKIDAELKSFNNKINVHDLPDMFHYWSNKYLKPKLERLGIQDIYALFTDPIIQLYERIGRTVIVASLGSGNCDFEIQLIKRILERHQHVSFEMHCYELNPGMLDRGRALASEEGIGRYITFTRSDLNSIRFDHVYDIFMANQSLHHFVNLEHIFESVRAHLMLEGCFIVSDMIGRNGHMRWPEAYEKVCTLWSLLDTGKKWNHQLKRHEEVYENWDCSIEGYEGIRAQDILPLLKRFFHFELFYAFGNIIDVFIDRSFGHNYDHNDPFDRAFIDFVAHLDERYIREGKVTPTHLIARMTKDRPPDMVSIDGLTPESCMRNPS